MAVIAASSFSEISEEGSKAEELRRRQRIERKVDIIPLNVLGVSRGV